MSEAIVVGDVQSPKELRLAVAMRGGVSLAVWMGGACQEIDRLRRAAEGEDATSRVYRALLDRTGYTSVVVDVLAGTSAGGLNAVLLSCSLLYDMPFDKHIRDMWLQVADILRLCHPLKERNPRSLLQGDGVFYADLMSSLRRLLEGRLEHMNRSRRVDLILTCTLLDPAPETFHQPVGNPITDARSRAYFRFRNLEQGAVSDFVPLAGEPGKTPEPWEPIRRLAYAARSTSSYPGAFEPATIWAGLDDDRSKQRGGREAFPRNMHGIFSESRILPAKSRHGVHVVDGGVLDNIPISWAIRSIAAAKANRPVDRWLLYLQPEPPRAPRPHRGGANDATRLRLAPVIRRAHSIKLGSESLLEDVEELRRYATVAGQRRQVAEALATTPLALDSLLEKARQRLADKTPLGYRQRQASVEATRLARLLETPVEVTGPDPLPFGGIRDPLAEIGDARTAALLAELTGPVDNTLKELVLPDNVTGEDLDTLHLRLRNLHATARAVATLLDCARDLERYGQTVSAERGQQEVRAGDLAENELFPLRFGIEVVIAAHDRLLLRRCAQIADGASPESDDIARDAAAALHRAAEETDVTTDPTNVGNLTRLCERVSADLPLPSAARWPKDGYRWLWEPLAGIAERLGRAVPKDRSAYAYLRDAADSTPPMTLQALGAMEILFGPLRPDPLSENVAIRFHMISADNQSPLNPEIFRTPLKNPSEKLAGNQLNNFAAFLSARWRQNDWTWGRLDAAASLVALLTRPERMPVASLRQLVSDLGCEPRGNNRKELVDQIVRLLHEQILQDELRILAGLSDEPPDDAPQPAPDPDPEPTILAKVGRETVRNLPDPWRKRVTGRVSRILWRTLKPPGKQGRMRRTLLTLTEPLGVPALQFVLRRFVK